MRYLKEALLLASLPAIALTTLYLLTLTLWAALIFAAMLGDYQGLLILPAAYTLLPETLWSWAGLTAPHALPPGALLTLQVGEAWLPGGSAAFLHTAGMRTVNACWPYVLALAALWLWLGYRYQERWVALFAHLDRRTVPPVSLHKELAALATQAGLAVPHLRLWANDAPNAFASGLGPETYQVTLTTGLLQQLTTIERQAVIGHELGHIARGDVRLATLCYVYGDIFGSIAAYLWRLIGDSASGANTRYNRLFFSIPFLIPVACIFSVAGGMATLVRLMLMRGRELAADAFAAKLLRAPEPMAAALRKIEAFKAPPPAERVIRETVIFRPLNHWWQRILSTHPSFAKRLRALKAFSA